MRLCDALEEYLKVRRALGFKLRNSGGLLQRFVTYAEQEGASSIATELAVRWAMEQKNCQPRPMGEPALAGAEIRPLRERSGSGDRDPPL